MPGQVNFYLKKAEATTGKSLIYLKYKYSGNVLVYSFGESVSPKHWNDKKQRVKSNIIATSKDGRHSINDLLDNLQDVLTTTYNRELAKGTPDKEVLKQALDSFLRPVEAISSKPTFYILADEFINGQILNKYGEKQSYHTLKTYKTVINHVKEFERKEKYPVDFPTIDLEFYRKYINFLNKQGLSINTRAKHIQTIKTIMGEALDREYTTNLKFRHKSFKAVWKDVGAVYLTDADILKLYNHDFSDNKRLEAARDLFVFGCYVGLRYSDYSAIKPENITETINEEGQQEYYIKIRTQKTGETVVIPCNPVVLQIFNKYKSNPNKLPRSISNQKLNDYVKEAAEAAGLTDKGRLPQSAEIPLYQLISSHTARRSFATNLYQEGFPVYDLMKITGHRTEKSFLKYLKLSNEVSAKKLNEHMRKEWSKKLLRVA